MTLTLTPVLSALILAGVTVSTQAADTDYRVSQGDFGGTGLLQMPSARMDQEGAFHINALFNDEYYRYSISVQLFSWLESTLRYTDTRTRLYSGDPAFSGNNTHKDKGIDLKARLWQESYWLPETSVGLRDIGGTGLFDGEFIASSKRFGPLDFTLGIGWGYMAKSGNISNPFCDLKQSYCEREQGDYGEGGEVEFGRFFKGDAALFAGVEYQTPLEALVLKMEYDANDYQGDFAGDLRQDSRFNFGAIYRLGHWGDLHLGYQRGNTVSFGFSIGSYFNDMPSIWMDEPAPQLTHNKVSSKQQWGALAAQLERNAGFKSPKIYQDSNSVTLVAEQTKYRDRNEGLERASTLLLGATDDTVTQFKVVETEEHVPMTQSEIDREAFKVHAQSLALGTQFTDALSQVEPQPVTGEAKLISHDDWTYNLAPSLSQSFGGAESDYLYSFGLMASSGYWLTDKLKVEGAVRFNLADNYDLFNYVVPPDGTNQLRVRTLVRDYMDKNIRIDLLQLTYADQVADELYAQVYGGYLETMFGGVGAELLYRPLQSRWALGVDFNYVSQRDPDSELGFYGEENQFSIEDNHHYRVAHRQGTGHVSLYYQPQFELLQDTLFKVSVGQYLAGDRGATFDFSKQFNSGVIVGAYASKTDMSAEEFGEGSFTKGFYITMPFDLLTVRPSTSRAMVNWQPLTRDGGQALARKSQLYKMTDARSPWYSRAKK